MRVVVRLPRNLSELFFAFPLLKAIQDEFQEGEFHYLVEKNFEDFLKLLPYKNKVHLFDREKNNGLFGNIKFCHNLHEMNKVDIYFNLDDQLSGDFMGFLFNGKYRIGFHKKHSKFFAHKEVLPDEKIHKIEQYLGLLESYTGKKYETSLMGLIDLPMVHKYDIEEDNYLVIHPNNYKSDEKLDLDLWVDFLALFPHHQLVFLGKDVNEVFTKELITILIESGTNENCLDLTGDLYPLEIASIIQHSKGLISMNTAITHLGCLLNRPVAAVYLKSHTFNEAPNYTKANYKVLYNFEMDELGENELSLLDLKEVGLELEKLFFSEDLKKAEEIALKLVK